MAVVKKTNGVSIKQRNIIIAVCVCVLLLIPAILWLSNFHSQEPGTTAYQGDSYSFSYPTGWSIRKSEISNIPGGTELFIQPPNAIPPKTPNVTIEVATDNPTNVSHMTDAFRIFNYEKEETIIGGVNAWKYTKVVSASEGVLHSTAYVFESKGKVYLIALGYKQQAPDPQLESEFNHIVNSVTTQ
ncbi:MAG TPA: PsbP-related protein [Candidatus Saccharimonadales bacterium]|nr:PsbP-related protein [Candidatus Saccharimonadales bacterium]